MSNSEQIKTRIHLWRICFKASYDGSLRDKNTYLILSHSTDAQEAIQDYINTIYYNVWTTRRTIDEPFEAIYIGRADNYKQVENCYADIFRRIKDRNHFLDLLVNNINKIKKDPSQLSSVIEEIEATGILDTMWADQDNQ